MTPSMQVLTPRASLRLQFTLGPPGCAISQARLVSSRSQSVPRGQGLCLPCPVQPRYHLLLETESATCVSCAPAREDGQQPLHRHRNLLLLEIRLLGSGSPSSWGRPGWVPSWRAVVRRGGHAWLSHAKPPPALRGVLPFPWPLLGGFWEPICGPCNCIPSSSRAFSSLLLFLFDGPRTHIWFTLVLKKNISWPEDSGFQEGSPMMCGSRKAAWGACLWSVCSPLSWEPSSLTHLSFQRDLYLL